MWNYRSETLDGVRGLRYFIDLNTKPATFREVINGWQNDIDFCAMYNQLLANSSYSAFRWETPSATNDTLDKPFEFVLLDNPSLARQPDPDAFASYYQKFPEKDIVEFANLGGDAILIVPSPKTDVSAYGHLAAFVRNAPSSQCKSLWRSVGNAMVQRVGTKPVWLSTAGGGVSWLHVRLDDRPKYYGFTPYRNEK
jgi:hypothetical protein